MKKFFFLIPVIILLCTCRKKSDITITAWNYALAEPIANAEVIIVETTYKGGLFSASAECKEIAKATTDANGKCFFNNVKLKKKESVQYAAKIKYSYGKSDYYSCNVTENSKVKLGNSNMVLNSSTYDCFFKIKLNNLLNPSITGDSMHVYMTAPKYSVPQQPYPFGGGGVLNGGNYYGDVNFPYPNVIVSNNLEKTNAGKHILKIYFEYP